MNATATEKYAELVNSLTEALLDETFQFKQGAIRGIKIGADEAGPRRPVAPAARDPRDVSDAARTEHARLRGMLDTGMFTRKDGSQGPMPKELRAKIQGQFDALHSMVSGTVSGTSREAAAAKLDAITGSAPEPPKPDPVAAFHSLFAK
jgi:hypothetical protein